MSHLAYRPDIDGLRALAVLPVVFFHLGMSWMPGGFVGVDVFFVISGYLITSIIVKDLKAGTFSILTFYERRIRRIFPALFVMMAFVMLAASVVFIPEDLRNAAQSAVAATLFASNVLFFLEAGYFDAAAYTKPLLHTWSLAIEEQFYIVLPVLLMILFAGGRHGAGPQKGVGRAVIWIAGLTLASFLLSALSTQRFPMGAYYLLPWRAWELGVGALLALGCVPNLTSRVLREVAAGLGLALILGAAVLIDRSTPFPGVAALAPVLGAALILHAGQNGTSLVGRGLSSLPAVWTGKLSYSLYLWHWPVIVGFVYWTLDFPDALDATLLFAVSLALAWISWRFVERPFRRPAGGQGQHRVLWGGIAAMVAMIVGNGVLERTGGLPGRLPAEAQRLADFQTDRHPRFRECFRLRTRDATWLDPCIYGAEAAEGQPVRVAVWGDSHAPAYMPAIEVAAQTHGERVALYAHDGCPGVMDFQIFWAGQPHSCVPYLAETFAAIRDAPEIETVIYVMRAPIYAQGWLDYGSVERDHTDLLIGTPDGPIAPDADRLAYFLDGLERTIKELRQAGKAVVLVYPLPEAPDDVPASLVRVVLRGGEPDALHLPRSDFEDRSGGIIAGFDAMADRLDLRVIRPHERFCDATACRLVDEGAPIFTDANHLSATVARRLGPLFDPVFDDLASRDGAGATPATDQAAN